MKAIDNPSFQEKNVCYDSKSALCDPKEIYEKLTDEKAVLLDVSVN